ncbi:Anaerobic magnesium-protoporphyrin IX monomethyl ester oxidative cyclase protein [Marine Group I thaumarchaeote SCGC AAA799-O18]|jgi:radical SAM superfamily enzyme YgiQ (UPF0313 family)|nr:Anaerobic magnesium-protoporphyrin IX monomethyl ester oxidative cyclase protein [Marine Group I thaumarchaeote SCGC AAA799-O18]
MKPLKIFLADLTYDTITLSTDVFPLNIGFIAAYTKAQFGSNVEIKLFKYIEKLEDELARSPPDILGLSNYAWCYRLSREISKIFLKLNPNGIIVWGGPNFPLDLPSQERFFRDNTIIDIYVPVEGEIGFTNVVKKALEVKSKDEFRNKILEEPIDGCITRVKNEKMQYTTSPIRTNQLDEIPSPYTTGILDEFFDGRLAPMIQTNRGCPFSCTFCVDGSDLVNKINSFSNERIKKELDYIAKHVPSNMHSMHISDLNFGMYPKDLEVCDDIKKIQEKYNFPKYVKVTSGKNKKEKIIAAIKKLGSSTSMTMSVQSMDPQVLSNIRRDNISKDALVALGPALKEEGLNTVSEVILGLPGETYASTLQTIKDLIHANIDWLNIWTLMLLDGSELNTPKERKKWNLKSKFRIIPRDFVKLKNGTVVTEIEEVGIGSSTLSFDEYVELRLFALVLKVARSGTIFAPLFKFLKEQNVDIFDLLYKIFKSVNLAPKNLQELFEQFKQSTINELWDSPEEIEKNYQNESEYKKLLDGKEGQNLIYYYHALSISEYTTDWTEFVLQISEMMITQGTKISKDVNQQFQSVANYCRGLGHNVLGKDRMQTEPKFFLDYNIMAWMNTEISSLSNFKNKKKEEVVFQLTEEQFNLVEDNLGIFGNTPTGRSQVIKVIPESKWWRKPVIVSSH